MPEIIPSHVPSPRTLLAWDGTAYRPVAIDALGRLNVNVLANVGLDDALQSVGTDRLIVRGEDQLFSYAEEYMETIPTVSAAGAWEFCNGSTVPPGEVWVVTSASAVNRSGVSTVVQIGVFDGVATHYLRQVPALLQNTSLDWQGHTYMVEDDVLSAGFQGTGGGDLLDLSIHGYKMTLEV